MPSHFLPPAVVNTLGGPIAPRVLCQPDLFHHLPICYLHTPCILCARIDHICKEYDRGEVRTDIGYSKPFSMTNDSGPRKRPSNNFSAPLIGLTPNVPTSFGGGGSLEEFIRGRVLY